MTLKFTATEQRAMITNLTNARDLLSGVVRLIQERTDHELPPDLTQAAAQATIDLTTVLVYIQDAKPTATPAERTRR